MAVKGRFAAMIQDTLHSQALDSIPYFDAVKLRAAVREVPELDDPIARESRGWAPTEIASACMLHERYGV